VTEIVKIVVTDRRQSVRYVRYPNSQELRRRSRGNRQGFSFGVPVASSCNFRAGALLGFVPILVRLFLFRLFLGALLRLHFPVRVVFGFGLFV
jgi:hypothetical protein